MKKQTIYEIIAFIACIAITFIIDFIWNFNDTELFVIFFVIFLGATKKGRFEDEK